MTLEVTKLSWLMVGVLNVSFSPYHSAKRNIKQLQLFSEVQMTEQ